MKYVIKVIDKASGEVVKTMETNKESVAHKVFNALLQQINHYNFKVYMGEV